MYIHTHICIVTLFSKLFTGKQVQLEIAMICRCHYRGKLLLRLWMDIAESV